MASLPNLSLAPYDEILKRLFPAMASPAPVLAPQGRAISANPPTMDEYFQQNPDMAPQPSALDKHPWGMAIMRGLQELGAGLQGHPGLGANAVQEDIQYKRNLPRLRQQIYNEGVLEPAGKALAMQHTRGLIAAQPGAQEATEASTAHTKAETNMLNMTPNPLQQEANKAREELTHAWQTGTVGAPELQQMYEQKIKGYPALSPFLNPNELQDIMKFPQTAPTFKVGAGGMPEPVQYRGKTYGLTPEPGEPPEITKSRADALASHNQMRTEKRSDEAFVAERGGTDRLLARSDRSYQFHIGRIDALRKPVEDRMDRLSRLEDTLNQGTPQADSLVAPELLSVMAGGQSSGLRMNEAEIARIVGGRTQWEDLKAKAQAWQQDPNKGFALTPPQRQQVKALFTTVKDRSTKKMQAIDEESNNLSNTDNPSEHRAIYNRLQKRLSDVDTSSGAQAAVGPQVGQTVKLKNGKTAKVKAVHPDGSFDVE